LDEVEWIASQGYPESFWEPIKPLPRSLYAAHLPTLSELEERDRRRPESEPAEDEADWFNEISLDYQEDADPTVLDDPIVEDKDPIVEEKDPIVEGPIVEHKEPIVEDPPIARAPTPLTDEELTALDDDLLSLLAQMGPALPPEPVPTPEWLRAPEPELVAMFPEMADDDSDHLLPRDTQPDEDSIVNPIVESPIVEDKDPAVDRGEKRTLTQALGEQR